MSAAPALAAVTSPRPPVIDNGDPEIVGGNILRTPVVDGRAWVVNGRLSGLYDTNIIRRIDGDAAYRVSPLVHFGAGLPVGRQQLFIGADLGRDIVSTVERLNRSRSAIGGGIAWRVGAACSGILGAETHKRLSLFSEQGELVDNVQTNTGFGGSIGCQIRQGFGFGGSIQRRTITNDLEARVPFNLRSTVYAPNIFYGSPNLGQFSLTGSLNTTSYPNRQSLTPDGFVDEGIRIFQGRFGYQRTLGTRLQLGIGISYIKSSPVPDSQILLIDNQLVLVPRDSFTGSGYDLSLVYSPSTRLTVNLAANRNVQVTPNVGARFVVRNDYGIDASYRIGPSVNVGVGGRLTKSDFKDSFTTVTEVARNSDNTKLLYADLGYSPVPLYSIGLRVARQWRRSDPILFNYDSTTVRLNLSVRFGRG